MNASFKSKEDLQNERDVLALMAPWLRDDVITTINRGIVRSVPILDRVVRSQAHTGGGQELLQHLIDIMAAKVRPGFGCLLIQTQYTRLPSQPITPHAPLSSRRRPLY